MNQLPLRKLNTFFSESRWRLFDSPFYFTRRELYKGIVRHAGLFHGRLIDLGCGTKPYRHLFVHVSEYLGLDIEQSGNGDTKQLIDVFYDGKTFPFSDNSADGFFSSETFEHIFNLEEIIPEIHRVLKKDGLLLVTCPFFWPEHEIPYDYARYTSFGIAHLLKKNGFEIITQEKTGNYITAMLQMQALYLYYFINKIPWLHSIFFVLFISPLYIFGSLLNKILPRFMKRKDLYLNNIILARKVG